MPSSASLPPPAEGFKTSLALVVRPSSPAERGLRRGSLPSLSRRRRLEVGGHLSAWAISLCVTGSLIVPVQPSFTKQRLFSIPQTAASQSRAASSRRGYPPI